MAWQKNKSLYRTIYPICCFLKVILKRWGLIGILLLLLGLWVFSPIKSQDYISLNQCFIRAPQTHYYPYTYTLGSLVGQVIQCESGGRQHDNEGNLIRGKANEIGIAQFKQGTWDAFNKERGTTLDITSKNDQLNMINWAFENGYQNHWSCYEIIMSKMP